jgi:hypothetical protein
MVVENSVFMFYDNPLTMNSSLPTIHGGAGITFTPLSKGLDVAVRAFIV